MYSADKAEDKMIIDSDISMKHNEVSPFTTSKFCLKKIEGDRFIPLR